MNKLDTQYQSLLQTILDYGVEKKDRTGTGTKSIFGYTIRHNMRDGFPLLTTKKMAWKQIVTELLWFLRGDTNIKFLVDNGCHIWDGDAYKNYDKFCIDTKWMEPVKKELNGEIYDMGRKYDKEEFINRIKTDDEFAKKWGELGPVYGKQWRNWKVGERKLRWGQLNEQQKSTVSEEILENTHSDVAFFTEEKSIDQITNLINDIKTNPDSRRLMVSAWNVGELDQMVLPPCHYGFQVYTRELSVRERLVYWHDNSGNDIFPEGNIDSNNLDKLNVPKRAISLMWNQRSVDTFLGLPFNIASYGLLLEIIAKMVNMVPDQLIGNLGDVHLYSNHIEQAKEQIGRDYSVEERLEFLYEKEPDFDASKAFGIARDIKSFCHHVIDDHGIPRRTREPLELPTLDIKLHFRNDPAFVPEYWLIDDFELINYQFHPAIKASLSN